MDMKQKLFNEINDHLMQDEKPSLYFNGILGSDVFIKEHPFTMLSDLQNIRQSPEHHPEGSVWNHTMLVIDNAARRKEKSKDKRVFMWAALLHDIGKAETTKIRNKKITSYNHERVGEELAIDFLNEFTDDDLFVEGVALLIRWHMQLLFVAKDMRFAEPDKMKSQVDVKEVALLGLCDRLGRGGKVPVLDELENAKKFLYKCGVSNFEILQDK